MTNAVPESVIAKIRKLMALADTTRNSNPHEATAAAAKAQALMFEHQLEMAQIETAAADPIEGYIKDEVNLTDTQSGGKMWRRSLLTSVAKNNFCSCIVASSGRSANNKMYLIGKPSNIEVVRYLFMYLMREFERMADEGWERAKAHSTISGRTWKYEFLNGAANAVALRLREQREESKRAAGQSGTALIVVSDRELAQAQAKLVGMTRNMGNRVSLSGAGAYQQGQQAGRNIAIHDGVHGTGGQRRLPGGR